MKILLLGKDGQVGRALQRALAPLGPITAVGRSEVDLSKPATLKAELEHYPADVFINAAAYTAVDRAESEPQLARSVNTESVAILAEHSAAQGNWLIHYSTDYVFDGLKPTPYVEADAPNPLNVYGLTKLDGELAVQALAPHHLIFRTSWLHSGHGANFVRTILRRAREQDRIQVVVDQFGAPTRAELVAEVTALALRQIVTRDAPKSGLYHLTAAGETNWYDYARTIIQEGTKAGLTFSTTQDKVLATTLAEYASLATRPANCSLNCRKSFQQFGLTIPSWQDGVKQTIQELITQEQ
jgi:dTDP-4-dehydrorhamnose reductase